MSLPHALLTSLIEEPGSGSDLSRRFDHLLRYSWVATHQQIYRELARLEQAGLIKGESSESGSRRNRIYHILPAGRAELRRWLDVEVSPTRPRNALMVKMRAESVLGPTDSNLIEEIKRHRSSHVELLAKFEQRRKDLYDNRELGSDEKTRLLILKAGIMREQMWIDWCDEAVETLTEIRKAPTSDN